MKKAQICGWADKRRAGREVDGKVGVNTEAE